MLDDQYGMARGEQLAKRLEQFRNVIEMQARRRLVEQKEFAVMSDAGDHRTCFRQMTRKLQPLRLTTRQRGDRLAQLHVFEPHVGEWSEAGSQFF